MADDAQLNQVLEHARRELLDLTTRNRLLHTPRSSSRSSRLEIVDELSDAVFRTLVLDGRAMTFLARAEDDRSSDAKRAGSEWSDTELPEAEASEPQFAQPEDEGPDNGDDSGPASEQPTARHADNKLQTLLVSEKLQSRLLKLFYDARTYEEEQGVNILYLALGFLRWYEDEKSDRERFAPLLLVPVQLDRPSANTRFKLRFTGDDIATNLSLQARLKADFGIELPMVPETEEVVPSEYVEAVRASVRHLPRWEVLSDDMVLWFFSFAKFLMYRDLEPASWPPDRRLEQHSLIQSLLGGGFANAPPLCRDDENIDPLISPIDMVHVLDADSSQALVIEEAKQGRNLVIQGPPGTGKSQTITNLIAAAVNAGKTVLFVAEKMAALDVVQRRLAQIGLGDMTLELHSHKAHKQSVLQDLERALQLGRPRVEDVAKHCADLGACRDQLNSYLQRIHSPLEPSRLTPYRIVGELVRLRAAGTSPPDFSLEGALEWSRDQWNSRRNLLVDLVRRMTEIGCPTRHPWRGVQLDVVLPTDTERFIQRLPPVIARLESLLEAHCQLAECLGLSVSAELRETSRLAQVAQRLLAAPPADRRQLSDSVWKQRRRQIEQLVSEGEQYSARRKELDGRVVDSGWDVDPGDARRNLAAYGRSWFRIFHRPYRDAAALLRGIVVDRPPAELDDRLQLLDQLIAGRKARQAIGDPASAELGRAAFGSHWNGEQSDWPSLRAICKWQAECLVAALDVDIPRVLADIEDLDEVKRAFEAIRLQLKPAAEELREVLETLRLDVAPAFAQPDLLRVSYEELISRLRQWQATPEQLPPWVTYFLRHRHLVAEGLGPLAEQLQRGVVDPSQAVACGEMAYYESLLREVFRKYPELARFHGPSHEQLLRRFRELDLGRIDIARHEVAEAHFRRLPAAGAQVGEIGLVRREIQKKRRHLPLRKLLAQAGRAVQAIKPVFMMSPISIAQYLEPGGLEFDLLLMDEASQVQPVDALGAIARTKQIVVVGDSKQLPPTRFFSRLLEEDLTDDVDENGLQAGDMESILGLCCAQNVPQRMLSWHYRSRHHSLIAVSNREFYDDKLYVIPSPGQPGTGQGLMFHHVPDGVFDRGRSATNRREAQVVAQAVMEHARRFPDQTLGVGTFSVSQRDAILDELELLRRTDSSCEEFFAGGSAEPFFVKNLENIQGDERDVIFISVGYGKTAEGYMAMSFGPLSNEGGERRLNVLITRAREACRVYSSIKAHDIDLSRTQARGTAALKTFLTYAESGLLDAGTVTQRDYDSEFERQVGRALTAHGFEIDPQIGVAGFFIDLAVRDPKLPGRHLLGIECDGANYHRSRSARDRDRLRQAVLENRGWLIHRVWSTDWFHRPEDELRKLLAGIEQARIQWSRRESETERVTSATVTLNSAEVAHPAAIPRQQESSSASNSAAPYPTRPYEVASFRISGSRAVHQLRPHELARVITKIVAVEGPIHREEIVRRVTQIYGLQRAGRRVREAVETALESASRRTVQQQDADFYALLDLADIPIRDRGDVSSNSLRRPEMLPPAEIREAMTAVVRVHFGVARDEAIIETARLFGFRTTSSQLRQVLERELDTLLRERNLEQRNGKVYAP